MAETWIINESPDTSSSSFNVSTNFISSNEPHLRFVLNPNDEETIRYDNFIAYNGRIWNKPAYRTVAFSTSPTGDLLTWLEANAVKQSQQLETPSITLTNNQITWSAISNATRYDLYKNGSVLQQGVTSPYVLTSIGTYQVKAIGDGESYIDSELSNSVSNAATTYEHIKYNNNKIQVDSAIRDGIGRKIETTYATKGELGVPTMTISLSQVVSQSPLQIRLTEEQANIYTNQNTSVICVDMSALGFPNTYFRRWVDNAYVSENIDNNGNGIVRLEYDDNWRDIYVNFDYYTDYKDNSGDNLGTLKFVKLTQDEFDDLGTKDANTMYIIVNETSGGSN